MVDNINSMPPRRHDLVRNEANRNTEATSANQASSAAHTANINADSALTTNKADTASSLIDRAKAAAEQTPEVDRQKIDDIKQAIASGEFQVNPKAVAEAFVSMTLNATR